MKDIRGIDMSIELENLNLHIRKTGKKDAFGAYFIDEGGNIEAKHTFQYSPDFCVLSKLEDSVGLSIPETAKLIQNFGRELHNAVFAGEIAGFFKSVVKSKKDIRLKLIFQQDQPELLRIPWELMYDGKNFLSAYPRLTVSRGLEGIPVQKKEPIEGKIRILAVVSSPLDLKDPQRLQIEMEQMLLLEALDRAYAANKVELEFLDEASVRNIQDKLDEEEYHILHYTGHGVYNESEDRGYLLLEDDSGDSREVDNETIANLLAGYKSLRLVVLSGCQTAKTSGRQALSDLATPLLLKEIPAVVAMQYSVADSSAIELAQKLYTEISHGLPIDMALTRARKELFINKKAGSVDFATPVLYSTDTDCLAVKETAEPGAETARPITIRENVFLKIEQLGRQFVGRRKELRRIKEDFFRRGIRFVVLHGFGGIGKTVTASKIAEKLIDNFDGIYGFDCGGGLKIEEVILQINDVLKSTGRNEFDKFATSDIPVEGKLNILAQVLSQVKYLLIFDNFETLLSEESGRHEIADQQLKKGLKSLITQCKERTCFLFTSRYTFDLAGGRMTNVGDEINLGEMSRPEAIMIMNRFPEIAVESFITKNEIFDRIGGHPYTINMFGRHSRSSSPRELLKDLSGVQQDMIDFTLLDKSYEKLSASAGNLLDAVAVLKKAIPLSGLQWLMKENGKPPDLTGDIDELIHWGLIIRIEAKEQVLYQAHTLVKQFIKERTDETEWKKRLIKAARYYEELVKTTLSIWDHIDARELYYDAAEYDKAGRIVSNVTEYLHRWGFIDLVQKLNEETIATATGRTKAAALHHLGMIHQYRGKYEKAIEKYDQSLKIEEELEELGDKSGIASTLGQLGMIHQRQGDYDKAIEKYNQTLKIFEELGDKSGIATILHQLGTIHQRQGDYEKAIEKYHQSLKIKEELGDKSRIAPTLGQLGMIHQHQGNYEKAIEKYNQSLKIKEELGDKSGIAQSLHQLGMIHQDQGDYEKAVGKYNHSLNIFAELGDKSGIAAILHQLANIHYLQGDHEKAVENYNESLKIKDELGDKQGIALTLHQLGNIHYLQRDYEKAIEKYNQTQKIFEELGYKSGIARTLHQLGMIHQDQGNYEKAIEKYNQSLKIDEELGDKSGIALSFGQLGRIYEARKEYKKALRYFLMAAIMFEKLKSPYLDLVKKDMDGIKKKVGKKRFEKYYKEITQELKGEQDE